MIENVKKLAGICPACGEEHTLVTKDVLVGAGATEQLIDYIREHSRVCVIICDSNTEM